MNRLNGIDRPQQLVDATKTAVAANREQKGEDGESRDDRREAGSSRPGVNEANLRTTADVMAMALLASDVRTDKVSALQQSIAAGTYMVPAAAVADKLMRVLLK